MKIRLETNQRSLFVGTTGSGKSELAKHFLSQINRVLVIDPKHTFKMEGYRRARSLPWQAQLSQLVKWVGFNNDADFRVIYRPRRGEEGDSELSELIYKIGKMKHITVYIDELSTLADQFTEATKMLADVVRTGRERHIAVWSAIQRPRWVPRIFLTEAENIFQFQLRSEDDRQYMAGFIGKHVIQPIDGHNFWYSGVDIQSPVLLHLEKEKNVIISAQSPIHSEKKELI